MTGGLEADSPDAVSREKPGKIFPGGFVLLGYCDSPVLRLPLCGRIFFRSRRVPEKTDSMDFMSEATQQPRNVSDPERFLFRGLHPLIHIGTASDRYAGWMGQVYTSETYVGRIQKRSHKVGGRIYTEEVLPVESVREFFDHFRVLEIDFTFYRFLYVKGAPTPTHDVLSRYAEFLKDGDFLLLKVPQLIFARKLFRAGSFVMNEQYLSPETFVEGFYGPAVNLLGTHLKGFVFEQEYQKADDRVSPEVLAGELDEFFSGIPKDARYHVELRTTRYLSAPVFEVLRNRGVGQVLSHWTWLPSLRRQLDLSEGRFPDAEGDFIVRLLTPRNVRYEEAYARAHPFDTLVKGMLDRRMVEDTARLMRKAVVEESRIHVIFNNRAAGNAPLLARAVVEEYLKDGGGSGKREEPTDDR